jgi:hypothetical protein
VTVTKLINSSGRTPSKLRDHGRFDQSGAVEVVFALSGVDEIASNPLIANSKRSLEKFAARLA